MKFQFFFLFIVLLSFASCGNGKKGSVQLEITRGFATGNASFDGGLYIHGKNASTNEEFSMALATAQKASLILNFGIWTIRAVGWDNSTNLFEGDALCAAQIIDFNTENQVLSLQVSKANCSDSLLGSASYVNASNQFKPLEVYTCGALYDLSNPTLLRTDAFTSSFCNEYPSAFRQKAKGLKITLHNKLPEAQITAGLTSACIPSSASTGNPAITQKILPSKIPVTITLYGTSDCVNSFVSTFHFPEGLDNTLTRAQRGFDNLFRSGTSSTMLALSSSLSLKGISPFLTETPLFHCSASPNTGVGDKCLSIPTLPANIDYVLQPGRNTIEIPGEVDCTSPGFSSSTPFATLKDCKNKNGNTIIDLDSTAGEGDLDTITIGGLNYATVLYQASSIVRELKGTVGYRDLAANSMINSLKENGGDHGDPQGGALKDPSDLLSPAMLGGFYLEHPCTSTPLTSSIKKYSTIWEDGVERNILTILTNPPATNAPKFIVNNDPRTTTASNPFHRRLIFRDYLGSVLGYKTTSVIDFACDGQNVIDLSVGTNNLRIGRIEDFYEEIDGSIARLDQSVIYWNTTNFSNARLEEYRHETEVESSQVTRKNTSFVRAQKNPTTGSHESEYKVTKLSYNYNFNTDGSSNERFSHVEIDVIGTDATQNRLADYSLDYIIAAQPGEVFLNGLNLDTKHKIRYGVIASDPNNLNAMKFSTNGNFIHSYPNEAITDLYIEYFNGSSYLTTTVSTLNPFQISTDISFDGTKISVVSYDGTGNALKLTSHDGTNFVTKNITVPSTSILKLDTKILDNGDIIIIALGSDYKLYISVEDYLNFPTALPISTFLSAGTDYFKDFALAKYPDNYLLTMIYENNAAPTFSAMWCSILSTTPTCTPADFADVTPHSGNNYYSLSAYNDESGSNATISLEEYDGSTLNTTYKKYTSPTSTISWTTDHTTPLGTPDFEFNIYGMDRKNLNMTDISATGTFVQVRAPYAAPSAPGFKMNFMSLNPTNMISPAGAPTSKVFTDATVFRNIGGNL